MPPQASNRSKQWADFAGALSAKEELLPNGDGWKTIREIAKEFKLTLGGARKAINKVKHERFRGSALQDGFLFSQTWYRPLE